MRRSLALILIFAGTVWADPVRYSRTDLPFPAGINRLVPEGISNTGVVAGWSSGPFNAGGAFTWTASEGTSILTNEQGVNAYSVTAISDGGSVAGRTLIGGPGTTTQGVFRKPVGGQPAFATGFTSLLGGDTLGVNDQGVSAGWWLRRRADQTIVSSAWVFAEPGTLTPLHPLMPEPDSSCQAIGINNSGQVAGWTTIDGQRHAFRWSSGAGLQIVATPAGFNIIVSGINHQGHIVGSLLDSSGTRAVRIADQDATPVIEDLSVVLSCWAMQSRGEVINDLGNVAGPYTRLDGAQRAFLYIPGQPPVDLGDVIGDVTRVTGINNRNEVVFTAIDAEKIARPYYWSSSTGAVLLSEATSPPIEFPDHGASPWGINDVGQIVIEQPGAVINTASSIVLSPLCAGDTNADGTIDSADLSVLLAGFGTTVFAGVGGDVNADSLVNGADLSVLLSGFGCSTK